MDLGIQHKRALVIGGSTGLGYAVCEALAAEGVDLIVYSRNEQRLSACRDGLRGRYAVQVDTVAGDIASASDVKRLAGTCGAAGNLQILVLNTPRPPSPMRNFLDEDEQSRWDQAYQQQLHGALLILREVTPLIVATGWGRIVAITSASVKQPMPRHAVSSIFRAGVQAALKHVAMEVADRGVTVNAVAPATITTPTFATYHDVERRVQAVPMKRLGQPAELAATVAFLCSMQAGFISGQVIQLDGGATLSLC